MTTSSVEQGMTATSAVAVMTRIGLENDTDTIQLDDALWGGGMTVGQVVSNFFSQTATGVEFDFGDGDRLIIDELGLTIAQLQDDITLVWAESLIRDGSCREGSNGRRAAGLPWQGALTGCQGIPCTSRAARPARWFLNRELVSRPRSSWPFRAQLARRAQRGLQGGF
jgi:hypothetical protein